jgi:hypothetical protein
MHLTVNYDLQGNVVAAIASAPESGVGSLELAPGERIIEIDDTELADDSSAEQVYQRLDELVQYHRVEFDGPRGKLVRKA